MAFHVGQKVVCVNACPHYVIQRGKNSNMDGLTEGAVYTVRAVGECNLWDIPVIWLVEIAREVQPRYAKFGEIGFSVRRFRPVVEPKTDISIFTAMLTPKKATVQA